MIEYENLGRANEPLAIELARAAKEVIEGGWYILGKRLDEFERQFAAECEAEHCVGVASGLDALTLSILALELPSDSEIIVPSNTYIATILAILQAGHRPVLAEPDLRTYNLDPEQVKNKLTNKTRAIMPVHLYGKPCAMDSLLAIAKENGLFVVGDCAQAHGAKFKGQDVGALGDINAYSFYPTKNLGAIGDGGAVVTNNAELADKVRLLRNYGSRVKYANEVVGFNSRLDELQAALLLVKLPHLKAVVEHKRLLAAAYDDRLSADFVRPHRSVDAYDSFHIYCIRHPARDRLREYLLAKNIKTEVHYPTPPHHQPAIKNLGSDDIQLEPGGYPISEELHRTVLSLPISIFHRLGDVEEVCRALNSF
jgi:dTDP-4-amino-4,6-dideoxygalactose transaminase